jgi:NTE family protein
MAAQHALRVWLQRVTALVIAAVTCACSTAHYPVNAQLTERNRQGYSLRNMQAVNNSDSLIVMMTLSGGGYRAAAMGYAAIEVLDQTAIQWEGSTRTLLNELDLISAVSGGSLAAAYYASHPTTFLADFRRRVLDVDLQSAFIRRTFSPSGLWRQTSSTFGRGDLLQELLDEHFFRGLRHAHLPRRRPMVYINATDMRQGRRFEFSQDQFDHLCSDLDALPLARAVAASMAVPLLMSPVTVWNRKHDCPVGGALFPVSGRAADSRYIHLVDGGLADNTGLSTVLENVSVHGGLVQTARARSP